MSEESEECVPLLPLQQESKASARVNTDQVGYECTLFFQAVGHVHVTFSYTLVACKDNFFLVLTRMRE